MQATMPPASLRQAGCPEKKLKRENEESIGIIQNGPITVPESLVAPQRIFLAGASLSVFI